MRITNFFANIFLVVAFSFSGIFWYWQLYPYKVLDIQEPVKVLTPVVKPGEPVIVEFTFDKHTDVAPEIDLSLVDGVIYHLPSYAPQNELGHTEGKVVRVLDIPDNQPCGTYHLHWRALYKVNPIREIEVKYESQKFYVDSPICVN